MAAGCFGQFDPVAQYIASLRPFQGEDYFIQIRTHDRKKKELVVLWPEVCDFAAETVRHPEKKSLKNHHHYANAVMKQC